MLSFVFGGGHTRAEGCEGCDLVFFDAGELAHVLEEQRSGIKLSEDDRSLLQGYGVMFAWDRYSQAEIAMAVAAVVGLGTFVWLVRWTSWSLMAAAGFSFAIFVVLRFRAERRRIRAARHVDKLVRDDAKRVEQRTLEEAPAGPWAPSPSARAAAPASKPATSTKTCPFCAAPLPAGTTHCNACDSDFG
jgi:hypothetical protein